ncbi:MAG: SDR family NAD(P)-dependent oxidoreductase [Bacteroidota bacterium]
MKTSGNTILITGATSGIGFAFAEEFVQSGNSVIICGRRDDRLKHIKQQYPSIITKVCDIAIEEERRELSTWVIKHYPALNMVINNAGIQLVTDLTKEVDLTRVRSEIETNLIAPIHLSSLLASHLARQSNAAIINISSGLSFVPIAFMPVYCATKAAIHSFTLSLRYQLRNTLIKVFEIAPPAVDTELGHDRREDKKQTHGGIPVAEFLSEAMEGIKNDTLETMVGMSKQLYAKREEAFDVINSRFNG